MPEAPSRPKTAQDIFEQVLLQRLRACALKGVLKELSKGQHFLRVRSLLRLCKCQCKA